MRFDRLPDARSDGPPTNDSAARQFPGADYNQDHFAYRPESDPASHQAAVAEDVANRRIPDDNPGTPTEYHLTEPADVSPDTAHAKVAAFRATHSSIPDIDPVGAVADRTPPDSSNLEPEPVKEPAPVMDTAPIILPKTGGNPGAELDGFEKAGDRVKIETTADKSVQLRAGSVATSEGIEVTAEDGPAIRDVAEASGDVPRDGDTPERKVPDPKDGGDGGDQEVDGPAEPEPTIKGGDGPKEPPAAHDTSKPGPDNDDRRDIDEKRHVEPEVVAHDKPTAQRPGQADNTNEGVSDETDGQKRPDEMDQSIGSELVEPDRQIEPETDSQATPKRLSGLVRSIGAAVRDRPKIKPPHSGDALERSTSSDEWDTGSVSLVDVPGYTEYSDYPHAPELSEYQTHPGVARQTLIWGGLGALGLAYADQKFGEKIWGGTSPQIEEYPVEVDEVLKNTAWLIVPGFGVSQPERIGQSLSPTMRDYGRIAVISYDRHGIQIEDLVKKSAHFCIKGDINKLYLYGHSMGGMVATEIGAELSSHYPEISIGMIALDCTPEWYGDVKGMPQRIGLALMAEADRLRFHGGPLTRAGMEMSSRILGKHGKFHLQQALMGSLRRTAPGAVSNELLESQARYIRQYGALNYVGRLGDATIARLAPALSWLDHTVDNPSALANWERDFEFTHRPIILADSLHTGHANPVQRPQYYNSMLRRICIDAGIADVPSIRALQGRGGRLLR